MEVVQLDWVSGRPHDMHVTNGHHDVSKQIIGEEGDDAHGDRPRGYSRPVTHIGEGGFEVGDAAVKFRRS